SGGAARRSEGQDERRRHRRVGQGAHGGLQGAEDRRVRRGAAEVGRGQGLVAAAAGRRDREGAALTRRGHLRDQLFSTASKSDGVASITCRRCGESNTDSWLLSGSKRRAAASLPA